MSDDRTYQQGGGPGNQEERALTALRRLPPAEASAEARARAKAAFLAQARPAVEEDHADRPARPFFLRPVGIMANLAVAASLVFMFLFGSAPEEQWVVLDVVNPAGVTLAGGSSLAVGDVVDPGDLATAEGTELELQLGESLRFRMLPGTRVDLPAAPGRWFDRSRSFEVTSGEIFGTTGGNPVGFPLEFRTDELTATLTGTTFAVFRTAEASCVCLWEGGITVTPAVGSTDPIVLPELRRVWIYKDGRAPEVLPLSDMETMKLQMTEDMGLAETP